MCSELGSVFHSKLYTTRRWSRERIRGTPFVSYVSFFFFFYWLLSWKFCLPWSHAACQGLLGFFFLFSKEEHFSLLNHQRKSLSSVESDGSCLKFGSSSKSGGLLCTTCKLKLFPKVPFPSRPKSVSFPQRMVLFQLSIIAPTLTSLFIF